MDIDIDISSHKRDLALSKVRDYMLSHGGDVVRVGTFKTESAKSAVQTACRGLGIPSDIGLFLSSMIPVVRGQTRSLHDTYYGNEEEGIEPVTEFVNYIDRYDGLLETALGIEGLISGRSCHACGVIPSFNLIDSCAVMKAPSGEVITQYDLNDCEASGLIKYDFLNTRTEGMLQITFEMLIEYGHIKWQGSLRETYNKYLHPDVLDHDTPEYYKALNEGRVLSAFQFDTGMGVKAIRAIHPSSLLEVANANSLMRLMSDGDSEQPMDMYVRYKTDVQEWERDMIAYGLTPKEIDIVHSHLDKDYGVCSSQEGMMLLVMDKRIAGFSVAEANKLRKAVAKKKPKLLQEAYDLLFEKGLALGNRSEFLHYIWDVQIAMQRGYSFSILHTTGYSWILLQQCELVTKYPKIYWETAVLQIESGAIEQSTDEDEDDDDDSDTKEKTTNYEAIGSAIATLQKQGVNITVPDINVAGTGFLPHEETNSIVYGLKSIASINNATTELIMNNRPYTSLRDFYERMCLVKREVPTKKDPSKTQMKALVGHKQMMNLLQAGSFDSLCPSMNRTEIIEEYLHWVYPDKTKLTKTHIEDLLDRDLVPEDYDDCIMYHDFREYLKGGAKKPDPSAKSKTWCLLDGVDEADTDYVVNRFFDMFPELVEGTHWTWDEDSNGVWILTGGTAKASFDGVCNAHIAPLTRFMNSDECLSAYNESLFHDIKRDEMCDTLAQGEMKSCCCYFGEHELALIDNELYGIKNFFELEDEPVVVDYWTKRDKETGEQMQIPKFRIDRICGTVLGRNKTKHIVTILTEFGVVNCKLYSGQFNFYDRQLSVKDSTTGKNRKVEDGWFKRGNIVFFHGIRRGDQFVAKTYKNGLYSHSVYKVDKVFDDGVLMYSEERAEID